MQFPADVRYTAEHEWARLEEGVVTVGISGYAADQLGDVVFVELPAVGKRVEAGKGFGVVEAVKTVSDLYAPVAGEVVEVNEALADAPEGINEDPYEKGWMLVIRMSNAAEVEGLMTAAQYGEFIGSH